MAESKGMKKARKSTGEIAGQRSRTAQNKARQLRKRLAKARLYNRTKEVESISASIKSL